MRLDSRRREPWSTIITASPAPIRLELPLSILMRTREVKFLNLERRPIGIGDLWNAQIVYGLLVSTGEGLQWENGRPLERKKIKKKLKRKWGFRRLWNLFGEIWGVTDNEDMGSDPSPREEGALEPDNQKRRRR